ncbi:MAG: CHAD domain-containing protein [Acidobacteriota bacterium]|jgi:CHAD domain-containing protein
MMKTEREVPQTSDPGVTTGTVETIVPLASTLSAGAALKKIHRELRRRIEANQLGVRDVLPGDYLHDFRVAVRRTRTGLRQLKRVYPTADRKRFADDFQWLSKTSNDARDLEVYLQSFDTFSEALGADAVDALAAFIGFLREHEQRERGRCTEAIESPRYRSLMSDWRDFLQQPADPDDGPDAGRPVREVAATRIATAYERVRHRSKDLHLGAPAAAFHRLRLDCKKLRYLLEFFADLFEGNDGARAIVALKQTQDSLGAINDLHVQAGWLERFAGQETDATLALGKHLRQRHLAERRQFLERFAAFTSEETASTLREFVRTREP